MTENKILEIVETGSGPIATIFVVIVILTLIILKRQKKKYYSIPVKTTVGRLIKTSDYVADTIAEYAEQRQSSTVGQYEYYINGKKYTKNVKTSYGGSLKDQINVYYRKGQSDASLDQNVTPPTGRNLALVFHFAVFCPVLAAAVWVLMKLVIEKVLS